MSQVIMIGCDLHDRTMLLRYSAIHGKEHQETFVNDQAGRLKMIDKLKQFAQEQQATRTVFAYEASGQGYGLSDLLHDHGIECHVLSPTHLPKTSKGRKQKTDAKDAQLLLELVRAYILAGNPLPAVWTPPQRLRDDRELVRARIDGSDDLTRVKLQILSFLKRRGIVKPDWSKHGWTKRWIAWLRQIAQEQDAVVTPVLESLIRTYEFTSAELTKLDKSLKQLAGAERYKAACTALRKMAGVGQLSALTFLTELGDLTRFHNRREIAAYLGLCPASYESGEAQDRKGHITRQGPARLRKILCQAAWVAIRRSEESAAFYSRIKGGNRQRTKKALVALMRHLAIQMWHRALECGVSPELQGRGGPHGPPLAVPSPSAA